MKEYIEREAVLVLKKPFPTSKDIITLYQQYFISPTAVEKIPAADVVPVRHGRWRKAKTFDIDRAYECSICGDTPFYDEIEKFIYCRRCGARMDGDGNG